MVYAYYRYSTGKQTEAQQEHTVNKYCMHKGISIDAVVVDRATSGTVRIENRNLAELIGRMQPGDTLVVSAVDRISRSLQDFCTFMLEAMPKLQARLIICNLNMDIDCTHINAMTQMQLMMFSFIAQIEREFIKERVQAGLDARKELVKQGKGWVSKNGNWTTKLGNSTGFKQGTQKIQAFNKQCKFMRGMRPVAAVIRDLKSTTELDDWEIAQKLNQMGFKTGNGGKIYNYHIPKILKYDEEGIYYTI